MIEMIESLETIGGTHGVGRFPVRRNSSNTEEVLSESPAAILLGAAHAELAKNVGGPELSPLREQLARAYARLIDSGHWFTPAREAIDGFSRALSQRLTGSVKLKLLKGTCEVVS
jgi:argininosuccinate synthase